MSAEIDRSLRVRSLLDSWFLLIVLLLVVMTVALGWWAYQVNVVPDIQGEERLTEQWSEGTSYNHSALIVNDSLPFSAGETIRDRPIYYTNLTKELHGTYTYQYDADSGDVDVTTDTFLRIRAGELEDQQMVEVFWEVAEPLGTNESVSISPGEEHVVEYSVDIPFVLETIATVERQVGATEGLVDVRVVSISSIEGTVEGSDIEHTYQSDKIMVVNPATFRVIQTETVQEEHQTFETVDVIVPPSPLESYGSIALFAFTLVLLGSALVGRQLGFTDLTPDEREILRIERARDRFSEWITTGTFPSEREYDQTVLVDDLEGLVDVAIDTNKRVIEDEQLGVSTVLDDEYVYVYVRPDSPARDWLVNYADTTLDDFERHGL
ncbi:MAG: DUF5305 domain-containing protein [Natronomonas sp.]